MRRIMIVPFLVLAAALTAPAGASSSPSPTLSPSAAMRESFWQHRHEILAERRPTTHVGATSHATRATSFQTVKGIRQISEDDLSGPSGSQDDTEVEPDIAVDPNDPNTLVAVFQEGRFKSGGGSVDIGFSTSHDGGRTWTDGDLPGLTSIVGGSFERVSDPAVAFGPDGTAYVTTLPFDTTDCTEGVAVQRSTDGLAWSDPVMVQLDTSCSVFDDKNWIAVDTFADSPFLGRIYVAWDRGTSSGGQPIVLRFSDNGGTTWSPLVTVSGNGSGIGVIPLVQPNGDLTLVWNDLTGRIVAKRSTDGGQTFGVKITIDNDHSTEPPDMRAGAGLPTAACDPVTGDLYAGWQDTRFRTDGLDDIVVSRSTDGGGTWSDVVRVNQDPVDGLLDHFTPDVAAYGGFVHVVYRTRDNTGGPSNRIGERYSVSEDGGVTYGGELTLGPPSVLRFAATAGGAFFYGDYQGIAANATTAHPVWMRSFRDPSAGTAKHQTAWSATILK